MIQEIYNESYHKRFMINISVVQLLYSSSDPLNEKNHFLYNLFLYIVIL